jgi:lysophospholipase L1-like esterase
LASPRPRPDRRAAARGPRRRAYRPAPEPLEPRALLDGAAGASPRPAATPGDPGPGRKTDIAVYDETASRFFILRSGGGALTPFFGIAGDVNVPVDGDFDGDGQADLAVYDENQARFYVLLSGGGALTPQFGIAGDVNIPVAGDFDGDGKTDAAVYDQTRSQFFILLSDGSGALTPQFGIPSDVNIPVAGDYDGDGKTDFGIYDQTRSQFFILLSGGGALTPQFGNPSHANIPVAGDYDGDGKTDVAVYDQADSRFFVLLSGGGALTPHLGTPGHVNVPVAGDYDGDGKADVAVYDQTDSRFSIVESGGAEVTPQFGDPDHHNIPLPAAALDPVVSRPVTPVPVNPNMGASQWTGLHDAYAARAAQAGGVVFFGDSITYRWGDSGRVAPGSEAWQAQFAPLGATNFGIEGDETQNVLWRVQHGELAGRPRVAVVMIGINNLFGGDSPGEVAFGVAAVVAAIRAASPGTTVLLLGLLPVNADAINALVPQVNALLAGLGDGRKVRYLDLGGRLLRPDGTVDTSLLADAVHPNANGYQALADGLIGPLDDALSQPVR